MQTALVAGALLAFALSFDEIIVTTFTLGAGDQTLPIWIFTNLFAASHCRSSTPSRVIVVLISVLPVYLAHRLTRDESVSRARRLGRGRGHGDPVAAPSAGRGSARGATRP